MSGNPFKNCIPFDVGFKFIKELIRIANNPDDEFHDRLRRFRPVDPSGGQWSSRAIAPTTLAGDEPMTPVSSSVLVMAVQFNERILPAKVRDERVRKLVAEIEEREGYKVGKREYAELRGNVEFELLPQAFIRRSWVYVTFDATRKLMLVHTSSAKRSDDVVVLLAKLFDGFGVSFEPLLLRPKEPIETLTRIASDGYGCNENFEPLDAAVLKGDTGQTVRIKDLDLGNADVRTLLEQKYWVKELSLLMCSEDGTDELIRFTINDKFVFKRIDPKVAEPAKNADRNVAVADFQGYAHVLITHLSEAVVLMLGEMGDARETHHRGAAYDDGDEL